MTGSERAETARIMSEAVREHMGASDRETLGPEEIVRIVEEMQADPRDARGRAAAYSRKYAAFVEQCPALFQKACRPGIDMGMLKFMVEAAGEGGGGEDAVGARLAAQFVSPRPRA